MYRHSFTFGEDGDYIVREKQWVTTGPGAWSYDWVECSRWLIPGTQLED